MGVKILRIILEVQSDLEEIFDYIAVDSVAIAADFVGNIYARIEEIPLFPLAGRLFLEIKNRQVREVSYRNYRIFYEIQKEEAIVILRVIHGARTIPPM